MFLKLRDEEDIRRGISFQYQIMETKYEADHRKDNRKWEGC